MEGIRQGHSGRAEAGSGEAMSTFRLTIKGSEQEAKQAAEERSLSISNVEELSYNQVVATCEADYMQLAQWYAEPSKPSQGFGYPAGTLLFFNEKTP